MIRRRIDRGDSADGALAYAVRALDKRGVTAFDPNEAAQRDEAVRRTVAASRDQLSVDDARRFQELAIFPEESAIPLTTTGAAVGLMISTPRIVRNGWTMCRWCRWISDAAS